MSVDDDASAADARVNALFAMISGGDEVPTVRPSDATKTFQALVQEKQNNAVTNTSVSPGSTVAPPADNEALIEQAAAANGVDPNLVRAIAKNESGFNPMAVSPVGAKGEMQLMDGTAAGLGVTDPFDPAQNLNGGARYLRGMLDTFHGDVPEAIAAYNAGPGAVQRYGGVPPYAETKNYVNNVLASYEAYKAQAAYSNKSPSANYQ